MGTTATLAQSVLEIYGCTNRGVRPDNQDAFVIQGPWFAVADGVGGHADGASAAAAAIAAVREAARAKPSAAAVVNAAKRAHLRVQELAGNTVGAARPLTTLTVAAVRDERRRRTVEIAHVGDSRA